MMKKWLLIVGVVLLFAGCAEKSSYAKVVDNSLKGDVTITNIKERVNSNSGLKQLQITGDNDTGKYMKIRYRVEWYDKDGFKIDSIGEKWTELPVYKNANFTISIIAPNELATDYHLFINK